MHMKRLMFFLAILLAIAQGAWAQTRSSFGKCAEGRAQRQ